MADASVQAIAKTPQYSPTETMALAEYIASLAPGPAIPSQESLNYARDGNLAQGGALFRTNCAMCHNFAGQGGIALGNVGPVTEGLLVWTLGLGLLIGAAVWLGAKSK